MKNKKGYIWNFLGTTGSQIIYLLINIILARFLSAYEFGIIGVLTIFITISDVLIDSGLSGSLIKEKIITKEDCSTIFIFNSFISISLYIILFFSAPIIESFFNINNLTVITRIQSLVFIINSIRIVPMALLSRELKFKDMAIVNLISTIISGIISVIAAIIGFGVYSLVLLSLVRSFILDVGFFILTKYKISYRFNRLSFKKLYSFGLFTTLSNIIDTTYENISTFLFGHFLSVSDAGYLSQSKKLEDAGTRSITGTINSVAFPVLVKYNNDISKFIIEASAIFKMVMLTITPLFLTVAIYAKPIISIIYGESWISAAPYLTILIYASIFMIMETITRNFIKSLGEVKRLFNYTIIKRCVAVFIIGFFLLISVDIILWGYFFGAIIGYIINLILYTKLVSQDVVRLLMRHMYILIPSFIYFIINYILYTYIHNILTNVIFCILTLLTYYIFVYWKLGLNIDSIRSIIARK